MMKRLRKWLVAALALSPALVAASTFDQNVGQFTRGLVAQTRSLDGANSRDVAREAMARASRAPVVQSKAQDLLNEAEDHALRARALAEEGDYSEARAEAHKARIAIALAHNNEKGLVEFKRSVEKNARGMNRDFTLPPFLTDAIGSFQSDYIAPLSERLQKIYGLIDTVYAVAQKAQGSQWLQMGLGYRTRTAKTFPVGFYNISFGDVVKGVTVGSNVSLGNMGEVAAATTASEQPTVSKLSAQVGLSIQDELNDLGQEARIGVLGLGYRMNDRVSVGAGVSAQDGNGAEPAIWGSIDLSSVFFK